MPDIQSARVAAPDCVCGLLVSQIIAVPDKAAELPEGCFCAHILWTACSFAIHESATLRYHEIPSAHPCQPVTM
jgi:hypothetical protein